MLRDSIVSIDSSSGSSGSSSRLPEVRAVRGTSGELEVLMEEAVHLPGESNAWSRQERGARLTSLLVPPPATLLLASPNV